MYSKDKMLTLHVRVPKDLLDKLSYKYINFKAHNNIDISFSEYIRICLNACV